MKLHHILFAAAAVLALATYHPKHEIANRAPALETDGRLKDRAQPIIGRQTGVLSGLALTTSGGIPYYSETCPKGQVLSQQASPASRRFLSPSVITYACRSLESEP